jgi:CDP-glucose 4,6-dehydratase
MTQVFADFYRNRRVLVTGDTGFKGSWLCQWLLTLGAEVHGFALPPDSDPNLFRTLGLAERIRHRDLDLRNADGVAAAVSDIRPEVVLHLAAQPLVRRSYSEPKATFDINVGGTVNVLEAIRLHQGVRACVVVTTDKCYENREQLWGYRETDAMGGHDPYSASKGAVELVVASYRRSFFSAPGSTRVASARAGNVIGGGDWSADRLVTDLVTRISRDDAVPLRNPRSTRPWQHALEPLSGYLHLAWLLCGERGDAFAEGWNFGPPESSVVTVETLARLMISAWGKGRVHLAGDPNQPHEAGLLKLDCSKARAILGWQAAWDLPAAVNATVAWYKRYYQGSRSEDLRAFTDQQIATYIDEARRSGLSWTVT